MKKTTGTGVGSSGKFVATSTLGVSTAAGGVLSEALAALGKVLMGAGTMGLAEAVSGLGAAAGPIAVAAAGGAYIYYVTATPAGREHANSLTWGSEYYMDPEMHREHLQERMENAEGKSKDAGANDAEKKLPHQGQVKGDVEDAPSVDAGKQGKHVPGHANNNPDSSQWKEGETGVNETQEAWQHGETLPDNTKVWDTGKVVGQNGETGVRVHIDNKGNIHGYPVNPGKYLK